MTPEQLLQHHDAATPWTQAPGLDVAQAYAHALAVRRLRIARGEQPRGYKVGFTNRTIWPRYGVGGPIWGSVWDSTLSFCDGAGDLSLAGTLHPRIEPETVFGIASTPPEGASLQQVFDSIDWVAPGFEIVDSHQAWKFTAADAVADSGLHARLLVGPRRPVRDIAPDAPTLERRLAQAKVQLLKSGGVVEEGRGANVLDGPLHALQHFLQELRACPGAADLRPGDVVTTGTWTDAWPVAPGELWEARFDEPLLPLRVRFG